MVSETCPLTMIVALRPRLSACRCAGTHGPRWYFGANQKAVDPIFLSMFRVDRCAGGGVQPRGGRDGSRLTFLA